MERAAALPSSAGPASRQPGPAGEGNAAFLYCKAKRLLAAYALLRAYFEHTQGNYSG
jgi:hypothetical protein